MTAYSQEHLKALNYAYSFFAEAGGGGGRGRRVNRMYYGEFENGRVFEECFFFIFRGELAYIHVVTFVKSCKKVRISFIFSLLLYSNHL